MSIENGWYFFVFDENSWKYACLYFAVWQQASSIHKPADRRSRFPDQQPPDSQQHRDRNPVRVADMDDQQDGENADALLDHL